MSVFDQPVFTGDAALAGRNRRVVALEAAAVRWRELLDGRALARGEANRDAVKLLQRLLICLGFTTTRSQGFGDGSALIDGDFGGGTERGLRQFQQESGLDPTGRLDAADARRLEADGSLRVEALSEDEQLRLRDVLDRTARLDIPEFKHTFREGVLRAAAAADVEEAVIASITFVESDGGSRNLPKFESHHSMALLDMAAALAGDEITEADAAEIVRLKGKVETIPIRAGDNGSKTLLSRNLPAAMAGRNTTEAVRRTLLRIESWNAQDCRVLATSWGWGQTMGWHTVSARMRNAGVTLDDLRSYDPARQIATLGQTIAVNRAWKNAARRSQHESDFSHFAEAYNGAKRGTPKNEAYASKMLAALKQYRDS